MIKEEEFEDLIQAQIQGRRTEAPSVELGPHLGNVNSTADRAQCRALLFSQGFTSHLGVMCHSLAQNIVIEEMVNDFIGALNGKSELDK